MHLHAQRGDLDAGLGAPALHHGNHQVDIRLMAPSLGRISRFMGKIHRRGGRVGQRAHRLGLRFHQHQHAPHIRMPDDRHGLAAGYQVAALQALPGEGERALERPLGDRHALQADGEARRVHHDEHVFKAAVLLADQVADRLVVHHYRGRAGVDAELVLDRGAPGAVAPARLAVGVGDELRHDEKRDPLHAFGRVRRAREHQVDDVVGQVVLAVGDEDLLARDQVLACPALGARAHEGQVRPGLRLGEVHRPGPPAFDHLRQVGLLQSIRTAQQQRFDRALGEKGAQRKAEVRALPHLLHRRRYQPRKPLPAPLVLEGQRVPPAVAELAVRVAKAARGTHLAAAQFRAFLVS